MKRLLSFLFLFLPSVCHGEFGAIVTPPHAPNKAVQFNNNGTFGGANELTYSSQTQTLSVTSMTATKDITARTYFGDGSQLTGIAAGGGGASSLAVGTGSVQAFNKVSSPTTIINLSSAAFTVRFISPATAYIELNYSSVTAQGKIPATGGGLPLPNGDTSYMQREATWTVTGSPTFWSTSTFVNAIKISSFVNIQTPSGILNDSNPTMTIQDNRTNQDATVLFIGNIAAAQGASYLKSRDFGFGPRYSPSFSASPYLVIGGTTPSSTLDVINGSVTVRGSPVAGGSGIYVQGASSVSAAAFEARGSSLVVQNYTLVFATAPTQGQHLFVAKVNGANAIIAGGGDNVGTSGSGQGDNLGSGVATGPVNALSLTLSSGVATSSFNAYGGFVSSTGYVGASATMTYFNLSGGTQAIKDGLFYFVFDSAPVSAGQKLGITSISGNYIHIGGVGDAVGSGAAGGGAASALFVTPYGNAISTGHFPTTDFIFVYDGVSGGTFTVNNATGTRTANYTFKNSSTVVLNSSFSFINSQIGIGTAVPTALLQISSDSNGAVIFFVKLSSNGANFFNITSSATTTDNPIVSGSSATFREGLVIGQPVGGQNINIDRFGSIRFPISGWTGTLEPLINSSNLFFVVNGEANVRNAGTSANNQLTFQTDSIINGHINFRQGGGGTIRDAFLGDGTLIVNGSTGSYGNSGLEVQQGRVWASSDVVVIGSGSYAGVVTSTVGFQSPSATFTAVTVGQSSITVRDYTLVFASAPTNGQYLGVVQMNGNNAVIAGVGVPGGAGSGDNLGNHIATQRLDMANFGIANSSGVTSGQLLVVGSAAVQGIITSTTGSILGYSTFTGAGFIADENTCNSYTKPSLYFGAASGGIFNLDRTAGFCGTSAGAVDFLAAGSRRGTIGTSLSWFDQFLAYSFTGDPQIKPGYSFANSLSGAAGLGYAGLLGESGRLFISVGGKEALRIVDSSGTFAFGGKNPTAGFTISTPTFANLPILHVSSGTTIFEVNGSSVLVNAPQVNISSIGAYGGFYSTTGFIGKASTTTWIFFSSGIASSSFTAITLTASSFTVAGGTVCFGQQCGWFVANASAPPSNGGDMTLHRAANGMFYFGGDATGSGGSGPISDSDWNTHVTTADQKDVFFNTFTSTVQALRRDCHKFYMVGLPAGGTDYAIQNPTNTERGLLPIFTREFSESTTDYIRWSSYIPDNVDVSSGIEIRFIGWPKVAASSKNALLVFQSTTSKNDANFYGDNYNYTTSTQTVVSLPATQGQLFKAVWSESYSNLGITVPSGYMRWGIARGHDAVAQGGADLVGFLEGEYCEICHAVFNR